MWGRRLASVLGGDELARLSANKTSLLSMGLSQRWCGRDWRLARNPNGEVDPCEYEPWGHDLGGTGRHLMTDETTCAAGPNIGHVARVGREPVAAPENNRIPGVKLGTPDRSALISWPYEAALIGHDHSGHPITYFELGQEPGDVRLDGARTDHEMVSDLLVGPTSRH